MDRPRKITAQVAPYLDAIRQARTGGWGWREIAERVAPGAAADAVRAAAKCCKYQVDQKSLPEVAETVKTAPAVAPASEVSVPAPAPKTTQTLEIPKRADYRTGVEIISQASNFETLK